RPTEPGGTAYDTAGEPVPTRMFTRKRSRDPDRDRAVGAPPAERGPTHRRTPAPRCPHGTSTGPGVTCGSIAQRKCRIGEPDQKSRTGDMPEGGCTLGHDSHPRDHRIRAQPCTLRSKVVVSRRSRHPGLLQDQIPDVRGGDAVAARTRVAA